LRIIAFSGLGADHRVFNYLDLSIPIEVVEWKKGFANLSIPEYAKLLSKHLNLDEQVILLGVSFGGLIAQEVAQLINPEKIILISSWESKSELNRMVRLLGKVNLLRLIPTYFFKPPKRIAKFLFGSKNDELLFSILDDTDKDFAKWATINLARWNGVKNNVPVSRIHGTNDRVIPCPRSNRLIKIEGGHHFMIVDKAEALSTIINSQLANFIKEKH